MPAGQVAGGGVAGMGGGAGIAGIAGGAGIGRAGDIGAT